MNAIKFPQYMKPSNSVVSTSRDVSYVYDMIYSIVNGLGADIVKSSSRPSFTCVFWKDSSYSKIKISIFSGTIEDIQSMDLTLEIMFREGNLRLYNDVYSDIINLGLSNGLFVNKIVGRKFPEFKLDCKTDFCLIENKINILFDMIESGYIETRNDGCINIFSIYKHGDENCRKYIRENDRLLPSLKTLLSPIGKGKYIDLINATTAVKIASEINIYIDTNIIFEQKGIMWEEAKRHAKKINQLKQN